MSDAARIHDLKTPLVVIVGYAELLAGGGNEEFRAAAAEEILAAARQLDHALDALLGVEHPSEPGPPRDGAARILLVDDDVFIRRLLRRTLPAHDFAAFLTKPFSPLGLLETIESLLAA